MRPTTFDELVPEPAVHDALTRARAERAEGADTLLRDLLAQAVTDPAGLCVVAVGGYGRRELSPHSDLDVVLMHAQDVPAERVERVASALWYPLWDRGVALDHAVRDVATTAAAARDDSRVAMGLLDARPVAGDAGLLLALRSQVLADWRREARRRVPQVRALREERLERFGWLAHGAVPDLKESGGGLRDAIVLRALVATWLVDVPHEQVEALRSRLLDVRDALHLAAGRRGDRLGPEFVPDVAEQLGLPRDAAADLELQVRAWGRALAHVAGLTWARLDRALAPGHVRRAPTAPTVVRIADGVGLLGEEVVLTADAAPRTDPHVALRAALEAARRGLPLGTSGARRLARDLGPLPEPWPAGATRTMVDLLTSGAALRAVWEELDVAGVIDHWLPEWAEVRLRGSSSPVHRYTIDRHLLETVVTAAELRREVDRPDLLAVAALLHDIGKGRPGDHSEVGESMARGIALRWGFGAEDADVVARLVRWHLLLPTVATRRDIEDPATVANVAQRVRTPAFLELLLALTEADARSTGPSAWGTWRRSLVHELVARVREHLAGEEVVAPEDYEGLPAGYEFAAARVADQEPGGTTSSALRVGVSPHHGGSLLTVVTADRHHLMADIAGGLALQGLAVRAVRMVTADGTATSWWELERPDLDPATVTERLRPVLAGEADLQRRMSLGSQDAPGRVRLVAGSSSTATVLDVRAADRRGLVWTVCDVIAGHGHAIRSAHLSTYGDQARDVFYVVGARGAPLEPAAAERLRAAVEAALA